MLVLPWSRVLFGSLIGPAVGVGALWALRERRLVTLVVTAAGVCGGTWLWNSMLNIRHAGVIDGDVPFDPFPISWQDTGTGLFCFAVTSFALLATVLRNKPGRRTLKVAGVASFAAFVMDVYFW
jgi:hypothetical protein